MTPTNELRFVEREVPVASLGTGPLVRTARVLQQQWVNEEYSPYKTAVRVEWRDVPLVKEET